MSQPGKPQCCAHEWKGMGSGLFGRTVTPSIAACIVEALSDTHPEVTELLRRNKHPSLSKSLPRSHSPSLFGPSSPEACMRR